jgi:hypothetical protein
VRNNVCLIITTVLAHILVYSNGSCTALYNDTSTQKYINNYTIYDFFKVTDTFIDRSKQRNQMLKCWALEKTDKVMVLL